MSEQQTHLNGVVVDAVVSQGIALRDLVYEADLLVEPYRRSVVCAGFELDARDAVRFRLVEAGSQQLRADTAPAIRRDDSHAQRAAMTDRTRPGGKHVAPAHDDTTVQRDELRYVVG